MKQKEVLLSLVSALLFVGFSMSLVATAQEDPVETTTVSTLQQQVSDLLAQIQELQDQIAHLRTEQDVLRSELSDVRKQFTLQLREGSRGEQVEILQEFLATDPEIYPEGIVTGYFGRLTAEAVRKFQRKHGISTVGQVGPQTRARLNAIFSNTDSLPPGLAKKVAALSSDTESDIDGEGDEGSATTTGKALGTTKITLCHKGKTITVGSPAAVAHVLHGDTLAPCGSDQGDDNNDDNGTTTNAKPVITLLGDNPLNLEVGDTHTDPGATANDAEDGDISADIVVGGDVVDVNATGTYNVTYNVEDSEGLAADEVTRDVVVKEDTTPADTSAPEISNVSATSSTSTAATITWDTDEASDSTVMYGTASPVMSDASAITVSSDVDVTDHEVMIDGLTPNTTYFYVVKSKDSLGNEAVSSEFSFTTSSS